MARPNRSVALLRVGIELLRHTPYGELTLDRVAESAGVTRGLILYYFGTRERYFLEVARMYIHDLIQAMAPTPEEGADEWVERSLTRLIATTRRDEALTNSLVVGMAGVEGVSGVLDEINTFSAERVCEALGVGTDNELLMSVLRAWGRACIDLVLRAIRLPDVSDRHLLRIMTAHLDAVLAATLGDDAPRLVAARTAGE